MQVITEVTKTAGGSPTVAGGFNNWAPYPGTYARLLLRGQSKNDG